MIIIKININMHRLYQLAGDIEYSRRDSHSWYNLTNHHKDKRTSRRHYFTRADHGVCYDGDCSFRALVMFRNNVTCTSYLHDFKIIDYFSLAH